MPGAARLVAFAGVLLLAFAGASSLGRAVGPLEREVEAAGAHDEEAEEADRLALELVGGPALSFRIVRPGGRPVDDFDVLHERRMHLILVRRDLTRFAHLHPRRGPGQTWFTPLALPAPGTYTAFADFSVAGRRTTLAADLHAPGNFRPRPLPAPKGTVLVDGYRVTLRRTGERLEFELRRGGRRVAVEPYLGARGHLVAVRAGDLQYLHVHADEHELAFEAPFPSTGRYRLFLQFKHAGRVRTAEFTVAL